MPKVNLTTPVGRLVMGSMYEPQRKDMAGNPLVVKRGPNAGQPLVKYFFAVAFAKAPGEMHWNQTSWGAIIWKFAHDAWGAIADAPAFAYKVVDGDSQIPNVKGVKPASREGYPGHWVVSFSSSFAPNLYNANGSMPLTAEQVIKCGYYIQINCDIDSNNEQTKPGIYINHKMVAFSGFGQEIYQGPDPTAAGFGQSPLPAGASATPIGGMPAAGQMPPPATTGMPQPPPNPAMPQPPPNPAILQMPSPPAPPVHQMTPKAAGVSYAEFIAQGWTDALLQQHGYLVS